MIGNYINKKGIIPENKYTRFALLLLPILIIISSLFSGSFSNSFFGKYITLQSGVTFIAIIASAYIVFSYLRNFKKLSILLFVLANLFITIPSIFAVILSKFGLNNFANTLVHFVDSWDTVALASGIIIVLTLIYLEAIASSKAQKITSIVVIILHTLLIICITIPDIWIALVLSSLFILLISKKRTKFYKKFSFYILIISVFFSVIFMFANVTGTTNLASRITNFVTKTSGINYNFLKPKFGLSMNLVGSELRHGKVFGAGPNEFYRVWQTNKPQSVVNSNFWDKDFVSSYSAFTTLLVSLGIITTLVILASVYGTGRPLWKKIRKEYKENYMNLEEENKFYLLITSTLFMYAFVIFLFFVNVPNALVLFAIAFAFAASNTTKWVEVRRFRLYNILFLIVLIIVFSGVYVSFHKIRSTYIVTNAIKNYQTDGNMDALEASLTKASHVSDTDDNQRLLSQFYIFKTTTLINNTATPTEELQQNITTNINNAITASKAAISLDNRDYKNYVSLGGVYEFLMSVDKSNIDTYYQNAKQAFNQAVTVYPKNPSIYLELAKLEFNYNSTSTAVVDNVNKSLQIKPNYSDAFYIFSQLAAQNNDSDNAIKFASQAVQSNPQNVDAYLQYGILNISKKDLTNQDLNNAYAAFVSLLNLDPNNLTAGYYLGVTYALAGEFDKAQNIVDILNKVIPNDEKVKGLANYIAENKGKTNTTETTNSTSTNSTSTKSN